MGRRSSLHSTGLLQGDDKWGAFQCADAFLLPSHQENFGIAVVEALSASTPVLLSPAINTAADIEAAGAALVEPDTQQGVCTLLRLWLALDPAGRAAMATNARRCFEENYQIDNASFSITRTIHLAKLQRQLAHRS
jgi:glycosyltransferase involved in cell wall biosynthesis